MAVAPQVAPESRPASDLRAHPARTLLNVGVAALAMVATLPGRTHGLGLITEPLLRALHLDRVDYANLNLWATLLGATFCVPWGWLIDRLGARAVLTATLASLGAVVVVMSRLEGEAVFWPLFLLVLLTRGLGRIGPGAKSAVKALLAAREDKDPAVRAAVLEALSKIEPTAGRE